MGSKKTKQESTNTYAYQAPPETADTTALRNTKFEEDPGIGHQFALLKEKAHNSYLNPLGPYTTPDVREKQLRATDMGINQEEAAAHRQGAYDVNQLDYAKKVGLAGLTAPKLVQTGGTQTTTAPSDIWGQLIGGAAGVGSAAIG